MRHHGSLLFLMLFALSIPVAGYCQAGAQAEALDPLLCAIPPQTIFAEVLDLRADTPSMKALEAAQTPEQRAALRASLFKSVRQMLTALGGDLDVEKEILPWLTGRAAACFVPLDKQRGPGMLLLLETQGGEETSKRIEGLLKGGIAAGQLGMAAPVEDLPVWKASKLGRGASITYMEPILMLSWPDACLAQALKHMKAINAGGGAAPVTQGLVNAPAGFVRFALAPQALAMARKAGAGTLAITGFCGGVRFEKAGLMFEVAMPTTPDAGPWRALANLRPTYSESIAGIPETALFALVAQRPGVWLHGLGIPILDGIASGDFGPRGMRTMGNEIAKLLSDVLGQEVALGIVPTDGKPSWLAVFTSGRADALGRALDALVQSGQAVEGVKFTPAPLGDARGWIIRFEGRRGGPSEMHVAIRNGRLLAGGSRKALEVGAETLAGRTPSVAKAAWFAEGGEFLGRRPLARGAINTRALGPAIAGLMDAGGPVPGKVIKPFLEALFSGLGQMVGGMRLDQTTLRVMGLTAMDYQKMTTLANMVVPMATGFAAARVAAAAKPQPGAALAPAAAQGDPQATACAANLHQLAVAIRLYARDWGKLPPADGWLEAIEPYVQNKAILRCPADGDKHPASYAFNSALAELPMVQIENPEKVILLYESASPAAGPAGTGQDAPNPARHGGKHFFAFVDGHVDAAAEADPAWWRKGQ